MQSLPPPLKLVFFGYGDNGATSLAKLINNDYLPMLVIHSNTNYQALVNVCQQNHITTIEYSKANQSSVASAVISLQPDLICIASFPYLIDANIINQPRFGSINVHTAALPKYRGYHPLNWAIIKDEPTLGVTIHYLDEGMDTGDIIDQQCIPLKNSDDINSVKKKLNAIGANLLIKNIKRLDKLFISS